MIVNFFEPPPAKKVGGLEPAIRAIENVLTDAGVTVRSNPASAEIGKTGAPEIVHFHGLWEPAFLRVSAHCRRVGIPYVVSPHGMLEPWVRRYKRWKKWPWFQLFERHHLAGAARLLTTSDIEARNLGNLLPDSRCVALPLGLTADSGADYVAARHALGWSETETVLLFLSRIHQKKGLNLLLQALAELDVPAKQTARLVIVGGGEKAYLCELMDFAEREQTRLPRIEWVGEVWGDEKWRYFQGADLFCLPSYSENFGLAVLEALQVGTRVLTTNQTPWTDVPSWDAGFICEPEETAVRSALEQFFVSTDWSAEQRNRLAAQIRARYAWDKVGPDYVRFYEDLFQAASH
jgi:glycosyltransferase involved in cell wall biosynthesis